MTAKTAKKNRKDRKNLSTTPGWHRILLTLTLVPMILGILLIGAWVVDITFWEEPTAQVIIGALFILLSFSAMNALQKRWNLALGWFLLAIADILVISWLNIYVQVFAIIMGIGGLTLLGVEFYKQIDANKAKGSKRE